jgi:hypothetical protein
VSAAAADAAIAHFVDKWLAREPEMRFVEPFLPPGQRLRFRVWGALLHELREAVFELSDPGLIRAKTGWWAEEMLRLGRAEASHPLTIHLPAQAPWAGLARALLELPMDPPRSSGVEDALAALQAPAMAIATVEASIFDGVADVAAARSLAAHWLASRIPQGLADDDLARLPMHLLARHGLTAADLPTTRSQALLRDWGAELRAASGVRLPAQVALFRRARHRLDQRRLQALVRTGFPAPPRPPIALWDAWRAARGA